METMIAGIMKTKEIATRIAIRVENSYAQINGRAFHQVRFAMGIMIVGITKMNRIVGIVHVHLTGRSSVNGVTSALQILWFAI